MTKPLNVIKQVWLISSYQKSSFIEVVFPGCCLPYFQNVENCFELYWVTYESLKKHKLISSYWNLSSITVVFPGGCLPCRSSFLEVFIEHFWFSDCWGNCWCFYQHQIGLFVVENTVWAEISYTRGRSRDAPGFQGWKIFLVELSCLLLFSSKFWQRHHCTGHLQGPHQQWFCQNGEDVVDCPLVDKESKLALNCEGYCS